MLKGDLRIENKDKWGYYLPGTILQKSLLQHFKFAFGVHLAAQPADTSKPFC